MSKNFDDRFAHGDVTGIYDVKHGNKVLVKYRYDIQTLSAAEHERRQNEIDTANRRSAVRSTIFSAVSVVGRIILILFIGIPVIQFLFTDDVTIFNLETILSMLQNAPVIEMSWLSNVTHNFDIPYIVGSWTILDGLRVFLNYVVDFLNLVLDSVIFLGWIGTGVLNSVIFITYFVSIAVGGV